MSTLGVARSRHGIAVMAGVLLLSISPLARAATFVVTKTADTNDGACDSDCSLREAIIAANANAGADTITLPAGTYTLTIPGTGEDAGATGDLDIVGDLTINGAGAATTIVDGGGLDRVFHVVSSFTVVINGITIRNGATVAGDNGGGLLNAGGIVTLNNCVISGNTTTSGGNGAGLYNDDTMTVTNCTVTGNSTAGGGNGGGIYDNGNSLTITNSTISGNSVPGGDGAGLYANGNLQTVSQSTFSANTASGGDGGGIYNNGNDLEITNCTLSGNSAFDGGGLFQNGVANLTTATIASNTATNTGGGIENLGSTQIGGTIVANNTGGNCNGTVSDGGTNLQFPGTTCSLSIPSADPLLGPLADNGGPTQTMAIPAGSPAVDANTEICPPTPATDQRGVARPQGPACDIGAFELQGGPGPTPTPTPTLTASVTPSASPTPTPAGAPTPTATPGPGPVNAIPTLSWPMFVLLGLLLIASATVFIRRQS